MIAVVAAIVMKRCVLGMNNQHPSEVMGTRREGPISEVQSVCAWVEGAGGGLGAVGHCLLEPHVR